MEFNGCRDCFFFECCSVRHEDGVNIVVVRSARFFYLRIGKDGIVYDLIDLLSGLGFFSFFTMTNHLPDFAVR